MTLDVEFVENEKRIDAKFDSVQRVDNYQQGYDEGYTKGHTEGEQAEYDKFWDNFQDYGRRSKYSYAFYNENFNDECYNPKYPIAIDGSSAVFELSSITDTKVDIYLLATSKDLFKNSSIETIRKLILVPSETQLAAEDSDTIITYPVVSSAFNYCYSLKNITIEGKLHSNVSFAQSTELTLESAKNIITALCDYVNDTNFTADPYTYKISFSSATKALLEAEGATSPNGNTWLEYVGDKGWTY